MTASAYRTGLQRSREAGSSSTACGQRIDYAFGMDYSAILRAIDVELDKLLQVRKLLTEDLKPPAPKKSASRKPVVKKSVVPPWQPAVTVLPPRIKREYRRKIKPHVPEPRALAAPRFNTVVVHTPVGKVATPAVAPQVDSETLEAVMRQKLLGGAA